MRRSAPSLPPTYPDSVGEGDGDFAITVTSHTVLVHFFIGWALHGILSFESSVDDWSMPIARLLRNKLRFATVDSILELWHSKTPTDKFDIVDENVFLDSYELYPVEATLEATLPAIRCGLLLVARVRERKSSYSRLFVQ